MSHGKIRRSDREIFGGCLAGERMLLHVHVYLWRHLSEVDPSTLLTSVRVRLSKQSNGAPGRNICTLLALPHFPGICTLQQ